MNGIDVIKQALDLSTNLTFQLIQDMKDAPLTFPTPNGGNHPLWILGHLVYSEAGLTNNFMLGNENPLAEWKDIFNAGTEPVADPSIYPSMEELFAKAAEVRENTMNIINSLEDDSALDQPAVGCPEEMKDFFGTWGQCLMVTAMHPMMHRGQVADARRTLGREKLMG